ncbi:hypothetical protein LSTR_LSTR000988 [Laodelphax striatellus]|uniref:C2H2-type domain-containing protein n=1 Tax=Laodelphax striatellus TaxID=195883 RepID=A0A482X0S8_LAOST|nr:hypothetical protein LSTR_LSTR000988 [Laodelphax striatellus]
MPKAVLSLIYSRTGGRLQGTVLNHSWTKEASGNYNCPDCSKSYKYRSGLYTHRKFECGKEPQFQCNICDKKFTRKESLATHTVYKHRHVLLTEF